MRSHSIPSSISTISVCSDACGARVVSSGSWLNWIGPRTTLNGVAAVGGLDLDDHVVGDRLLVVGEVDEALERRPLTLHRLQVLTPVLERLAADRLGDEFGCLRGILDQRHDVGEAWIVGQLRQSEMLECVADVAGRADDAQIDRAAVRGQVVAEERD